jgi:pseudouridine synthase
MLHCPGAHEVNQDMPTDAQTLRLQAFLARCGVASRRKCDELVRCGRVSINGQKAEPGARVDPATDRVEVDGRPVVAEQPLYIVLNKPAGVITTAAEEEDRPTVDRFVTQAGVRLFPVGRLDKDMEGALLMTNDGRLAHALTAGRAPIDHVYVVTVEGVVGADALRRMTAGVPLADGRMARAKGIVLHEEVDQTILRVAIAEGRQQRLGPLLEALGHPVRTIRRVAVGTVKVDDLEPGQWRHLTEREIDSLRRAAGLRQPTVGR